MEVVSQRGNHSPARSHARKILRRVSQLHWACIAGELKHRGFRSNTLGLVLGENLGSWDAKETRDSSFVPAAPIKKIPYETGEMAAPPAHILVGLSNTVPYRRPLHRCASRAGIHVYSSDVRARDMVAEEGPSRSMWKGAFSSPRACLMMPWSIAGTGRCE